MSALARRGMQLGVMHGGKLSCAAVGFDVGMAGSANQSWSEEQQKQEFLDTFLQAYFAQELVTDHPELVKEVQVQLPETFKSEQSANLLSSTVILVGVNHVSLLSADMVEQVVLQAKPTALVLEICKERLPDAILLDSAFRGKESKHFFDNPMPEALRRTNIIQGGEMRSAFASFHELPEEPGNVPKLLVLGDMLDSQQHELAHALRMHQDDAVSHPTHMQQRDKCLVASIYAAARLGHRVIVAPMGAAHLEGVEAGLAALSATDLFPCETGIFLSQKGIVKLVEIKEKLRRDIEPRRLQRIRQKADRAEDLTQKEEDYVQRFHIIIDAKRVWHKLTSARLVCEPSTFESLASWHTSLSVPTPTRSTLRPRRPKQRRRPRRGGGAADPHARFPKHT